MTALPLRSYSL